MMYYLEPLYLLPQENGAQMRQVSAQVAKVVFLALLAIVVLALLIVATADTYARLMESVISDPAGRSMMPIYWAVLGAL